MQDQEGTWQRLVKTSGVRKHRGRLVRAGKRKLAVYLADGDYYVTDNRCPHAAASLGLGSVKGLVVECPRHGWLFNLQTGTCLTMEGFEVQTYPVRVVDGWVEALVPCEGDEPPEDRSDQL